MRIGCGLRVHRIDGNEYLYFWHYERENGRSRRREDYVGPARDPASRQNGGRELPPFPLPVPTHVAPRVVPLRRFARAPRAGLFFDPRPPSTKGGAKGRCRAPGRDE